MKPSVLASIAVGALIVCAGVRFLKPAAPVASQPKPTPRTRPTAPPKPRVLPVALQGQILPGVWVLCYHRIADKPKSYTVLSPADFQAQMAYLKAHDFKVVPLQTIIDAAQHGDTLAPHTVALTFDDGFKDSYTVAYPILKQYKYPATLFIYPNYISNGGAALTWEQLKEMSSDPLISVQSHTYTHSDLAKKSRRANSAAQLKHELVDSKNTLEKNLGIHIDTIAYPYGVSNDKVVAATRAAGYKSGFSIGTRPIEFASPNSTDNFTIPRIMVNRGDSLQLWASRLQTPAPRVTKKKSVVTKKVATH